MTNRRNVNRGFARGMLGELPRLTAASLMIQCVALTALADLPYVAEPQPLTTSLVTETSWDDPAVDAEPDGAAEETSLAQRVAALERYIEEQKSVTAAAAEEESRPEGEYATPKDMCKELEPIVKPTFTVHGRIPFDIVTYDDDSATGAFFNTDRDNETGFRSFRLGGDGYIYENLYYALEVELRGSNSAITYKSIYMEQQNIPGIGHLRVGHFFEPLSLEDFSGDKFLTIMERAPAVQAFAPGRNFGAMIWNTCGACQDASWFAGIYRADSPDSPNSTGEWRSDNNDWCYDARFAWLPYYDEPSNGRYLVHLGGSYSFRHIGGLTSNASYNQNVAYNTLNGLAEFSNRSWVGTQGPIGYGTEANTDEWNQLGAEFLVIWGALSVQSEYFQLLMNSGEQYNGGYVFLSYFLTGDSRGYAKDQKIVRGVTPFEPFFWVDTCRGAGCGRGAWEIVAGYSWVNLTDGNDIVATTPATAANRRRGFNNAFVVGLGWWQNSWSHLYFDYEHEIVDFVDGGVPSSNSNILGMRWQVDW
jgi:phosphate-selective porin OprO/OprP